MANKSVARVRVGMLVPTKTLSPSRVSRWQNKKKYGAKLICSGHYISQRGTRLFVLANGEFRVQKMYPSHEAAKAFGWVKID